MAVPKRRKSKSRTRKGRNAHYKRTEVKSVKTKDGKAYKRAHIEERIEL
ncbi:MAG TPA: 50S ribosomal protein L32 [Patescibacteria group bacterium]|nr:50S ribosomal protein L32 [Patescibacteria group bacterium]